MIETQLWHPVIAGMHLRDQPVAVDLLGQPLVLWREHGHGHEAPPSVVHAWADRCPHRGARLSLGRVLTHLHGARLECPYHGWQLAGDAASVQGHHGAPVRVGRCVHVPAAPAFEPPPSHGVPVFEAQEHCGLVWVRLERPDFGRLPVSLSQPPVFEPWGDPLWRPLICGPYSVATSAPRLVENFLDQSHFGFVHEGWLGARSHAQVDTGRVEERDDGVHAHGCKAWQPRGHAGAEAGGWVAYRYAVPHPFAAILHKDAGEGDPVRNAVALFVRPDGSEACTAWFAIATQGDPSDDEALRAFQDAVFAQDRPIVESQTPKTLPIGKGGAIPEVHGPADRMSGAYRRYLARAGVSLGVC